MEIEIIVAVAENGVIGADGEMPWRLSTDLKRFKRLTMDKPMIMGRKTFESIGLALPGRTTLVVTRDEKWEHDGVVAVRSLDVAVETAKQISADTDQDAITIVGGGEIYRQSMEIATVLHVTKVDASPQGDTVFPEIDLAIWQAVSSQNVSAGEKDSADTTYTVFKRR